MPTATDIALFDGTGKKDATMDAAFGGAVAELRLAAANTGTITVGRSLTVHGNLSLSGGTLRANGGNTVTVKGSWQNGGATFEAGTGTVVLAGSGTTYGLKESGAFKHLSLDDGLVGHWRLDETTETGAIDSSRRQNNGAYRNGATQSTSVPTLTFFNLKSGSFDGTDDFIQFSDNADHRPSVVTVSMWAKASRAGSYDVLIDSGNQGNFEVFWNANRFIPAVNISGVGLIADTATSSTYGSGTWHHVVMTYDGVYLTLYVDGVIEVHRATPGSIAYTGGNKALYVGSYIGSSNYYYGLIDDIRIYNRALSHTEIESLYQGNQGTGSGRYTLGSNLTVNGNLNIYSGTLDPSSNSYSITASGSFVNNAGFTPRNSTVTLSGIGTHLKMYGTSIYTLAIAASKSAILRAGAVISNALTINSTASLRLNGFTMTGTTASISNAGTLTQGTGALIHRNSSISVSPASGPMGTTFSVTVTDADANTDGLVADTVSIGTDSETLLLTETGIATGVFTGTIPTAHAARVASNGIVDRNDACTFTTGVSYVDPEDRFDTASTTFIVSDTAVAGCGDSVAASPSTHGGGGTRAKARIERGETPSTVPVTPRDVAPTAPPSTPRILAVQRRLAALDMKLETVTRSDDRQRLLQARQALQRVLQRMMHSRRP